jgi:hypothetical protein
VTVGRTLALACLLTGCAARKVAVHPSAVDRAEYIDLQPGWRLRVVTPVLKSGGFQLQPAGQQFSGSTITLSAGADFLGYELAYYAVRSRNGAGVRVEFSSAEITKEGQVSAQSRPLAPLFQLPRSARYVRLIFLTRISRADHDMAVVAARESQALDALTRRVLADPASACTTETLTYCAWIPKGIAVAPEQRRVTDGVGQWVPAR